MDRPSQQLIRISNVDETIDATISLGKLFVGDNVNAYAMSPTATPTAGPTIIHQRVEKRMLRAIPTILAKTVTIKKVRLTKETGVRPFIAMRLMAVLSISGVSCGLKASVTNNMITAA